MWSPDSEINSIGMTIRHSISASSGKSKNKFQGELDLYEAEAE